MSSVSVGSAAGVDWISTRSEVSSCWSSPLAWASGPACQGPCTRGKSFFWDQHVLLRTMCALLRMCWQGCLHSLSAQGSLTRYDDAGTDHLGQSVGGQFVEARFGMQ